MAVFMLNICKFKDCGLTFKSLGHLIQHIEETHIDFDPQVVEQTEQQVPPCIPMSYVLRFITDATKKENSRLLQQAHYHQTTVSSCMNIKANSSAVSETEEVEDCTSDFDNSNDSWIASEDLSSDCAFQYNGVINNNTVNQNNISDKPFACSMPGCKKRYKNVNGIKYHKKNGHKNDGKIQKAFNCACGKSYKTLYGLKNHNAMQHNGSQIKTLQHNKSASKTESDYERSSYNFIEESGSFERSSKPVLKLTRMKVDAIEDHGYMKSDSKSDYLETDYESSLGVLTPAASPPIPGQSSLKTEYVQMNSLHKYFTVNSNKTHCD